MYAVLLRSLLVSTCITLIACNKPTPEKYFDVAVLNTNLVNGFASNGMERELELPSMKMGNTKDEFAPMKRIEVIQDKIQSIEKTYDRVRSLPPDDDANEMIQSSRSLYEYILPVYRKEYLELATLYDEGAAKNRITAKAIEIQERYGSGFEERYEQLIKLGKRYAAKHHIVVRWNS